MMIRGLFAAVVFATGGCTGGAPQEFQVGEDLPSAFRLPSDEGGLLWILHPADYIRCETQAREIRAVQRQGGSVPGLTLIAVGGHDRWAHAFVRRERLEGTILSMSEEAFQRRFGRKAVSALYVLDGRRVVASFPVLDTGAISPGELTGLLAAHRR
jgi:hypothetical protein